MKLEKSAMSSTSMPAPQERLFSSYSMPRLLGLLEQILPDQDAFMAPVKYGRQPKEHDSRPGFSLPVMSNNFRRFNARIGVVFVFQNRLARLMSWKTPTHTLSLLAVYTFCCLNPKLLLILPLASCLFFIMVPAFLVQHPAAAENDLLNTHTTKSSASSPSQTSKQLTESSKDIFRNMRDLQNCMEDFSVIHDQLIGVVDPFTNFSDERLSSTIFLTLFAMSSGIFIVANPLPYRTVLLLAGWSVILNNHPVASSFVNALVDLKRLRLHGDRARRKLQNWMNIDIILTEAPEVRLVEIFEVQRRNNRIEWTSWLYSPSAYEPQSSVRLSGRRPEGTPFFEDVQPPHGWDWDDKKWTLDVLSQDWVEDRMIVGVDIQMEGERWVFDIGSDDSIQDEAMGNSTNLDTPQDLARPDWEEGSGSAVVGEWRRRRWRRRVKRKAIGQNRSS